MKIPNPIDLIAKYLGAQSVVPPDLEGIAEPSIIKGVRVAFWPLLAPLMLLGLGLNAAEEQALAGRDPSYQRRRSRAFLRLATARLALSQRAGVDPDILDKVIGKDEGCDILSHTIGQFLALVDDGLLQVRAALSLEIIDIMHFVQQALGSGSTAADLQSKLLVHFGAVSAEAGQKIARAGKSAAQSDAKVHGLQTQIDKAKEAQKVQPLVARLVQAAEQGRDLGAAPAAPLAGKHARKALAGARAHTKSGTGQGQGKSKKKKTKTTNHSKKQGQGGVP